MNNIDELLKSLDEEQKKIELKRKALLELKPRIEDYPKPLNLSFGWPNTIDIDYVGRAETINLITHFKAGRWDKTLSNHPGKIDYVNKNLTSIPLRIYGAEPPPSCKIVEVEVEIPAQPARIEKVRKVVCKPDNGQIVA
jgi:hypothetical protein